MARAKPIAEEIPLIEEAPEPVPIPVQVLCNACKHWRRPWPTANVGECALTRRFLPAPIMTTDLNSCSQAEQ